MFFPQKWNNPHTWRNDKYKEGMHDDIVKFLQERKRWKAKIIILNGRNV